MKTSIAAIICGAVAGATIACGGMAQRKAQPAPYEGASNTTEGTAVSGAEPGVTSPGVAPVPGASPQLDDILQLDKEIRGWRTELGLSTDPPLSERQAWATIPMTDAIAICPDIEPTTGTCQDVCTLAGHICGNAEAICDLAEDLPGNAWAQDKCASAKVSCKDGRERCCECKADESDTDLSRDD